MKTRTVIISLIVIMLLPASVLANYPPRPLSVSPNTGSGSRGLFVARFRDRDGWRDLKTVKILFNPSSLLAGGLAAMYRVDTGRFFLHDGTRWLGGFAAGSNRITVSGAGALHGSGCAVTHSGGLITVTFDLSFQGAAENRSLSVWLSVLDRSGAASGWRTLGEWTVPGLGEPPPLQVFPPDNPWNTDISGWPVDARSAHYIASIGRDTGLHSDFGTVWEGKPIGIPCVFVRGDQPKVPITFYYPDESDPGPYPIPADAPIEGGSDHHILVIDVDHLLLYEVYDATKTSWGWGAGSGAIFDLTSNALRPDYWTSADAAGLPIFPGLVRYDEVESGTITHAVRFTVSRSQRGFIHPATHFASDETDANLPPMGLRLRLKASFDITGYSPRVQVILRALKKYGMFVADNGADWYITGAPDPRWDDEELSVLREVKGSDFEVVHTGSIITD